MAKSGEFYAGIDPNRLPSGPGAGPIGRPVTAQNPFLGAPVRSQGGQSYNPLLDPTGGFARSTKIGGLISGLFGNGMTRAEYQQQQQNTLQAQAVSYVIDHARQIGAQPAILKLIESPLGQQLMVSGGDFDGIAEVANLAAAGKVREARARAFGQSPAPQVQSQPQAVAGDAWAGMRTAGEAVPAPASLATPQVVAGMDHRYGDSAHLVEIAQELFAAGDDEGGKNALALANTALAIEKELQVPTTESLKEYNFYVAQRQAAGEQPLSFFDWQIAMKKAGSQSITIGGQGESEFQKELGKQTAQQWAELQKQGRKAAAMTQDLEALDFLIEIAPQQPGMAFEFAIPYTGARFPGLGAFTEGGQAFNSIVKRLAPSLRVEGSGSTSDMEMHAFMDSLPSLGNHIGANRYVVAVLKAKAAIDLERSAIVDMVATGELDLTEGRKRLNALNAKSIMTDPAVEKAYLALQTSYVPKQQRAPSPVPGGSGRRTGAVR